MTSRMYRYSATVNGRRRSVILWADLEELGRPEGEQLTLEDTDLIVMNDHTLYSRFYTGATGADFDAERLAPTLEVQHPATWETIDKEPRP